ncbi:hypothetical protein EMCRGX_G024908 [Ephydatia muelleri]
MITPAESYDRFIPCGVSDIAILARSKSKTPKKSKGIQNNTVSAAPLTLENSVTLHEPTRPNPSDLKGKGRECAELAQKWDQLLLKDDVLYRQFKDTTGNQRLQVVVPKEMPKVSRQTVRQNLDTQVNFEHEEHLNTTGRENPGKEAPQDGIGREDTENVAPQNNPTDNVEVSILPTPSPVASGG